MIGRAQLLERQDGPQLLRPDVLRHKPEADKRLDDVARPAGDEDHQRIPPQVTEPFVYLCE